MTKVTCILRNLINSINDILCKYGLLLIVNITNPLVFIFNITRKFHFYFLELK